MLLDEVKNLDDRVQVDSITNNIIVLNVVKDSPAFDAGIRGGDSLIRFAGLELNELESFENFANLVDSKEGQKVPVTYISKNTGEEISTEVDLVREDNNSPLFGVGSNGFGYLVSLKAKDLSTAVSLAVKQTWTIFRLNFEVLGNIVKAILPFATDRSALNAVGGPVAVGNVGNQIYNLQGASGILNIMAVVSVSLAAFNLLPLPALDGGRLLLIYLNKLTGKRNKKLEGVLIGFTFILLLGLGVVIAFKDVNNIVSGKSLF
ncbi:PDZ domain-containing protein [Candidatus Gracilibacteria bacterium]|nr:PDZ domain-containing protein [Candidatus Gracilibacteria bacterium]